ncbi:MAG TPA: hypothetical protein VL907_08630 [Pyrinomonadaceae bacterium]|jgi:hypothetical protein|nr:hypothetical protein [Pyrinomonadaceae bacterium]
MKLTSKLAAAVVAVLITALFTSLPIHAQQTNNVADEKRVPLNEAAMAHDANGVSALQATLRTTALNGTPDSPVTNVRLIIKNTSGISYSFVSGVVTFYDASGVRCGEGIFKADALAVDESFDSDSPGVRIRCEVTTWRLVATNLLPRNPPTMPPVQP